MLGWILIGVILHKLEMLHGWVLFMYILGCLNCLTKTIITGDKNGEGRDK